MTTDIGRPVIEVDDLAVEFQTPFGIANVLNGVSLQLRAGETLGILGESGSGKSITAAAIMGLLPTPPARITKGSIRLRGQNLLALTAKQRRTFQGDRIAMVFQDAVTSLNPGLRVGYQIAEMFRVHRGTSKAAARAAAIDLMDRVKIPAARSRFDQYPYEFSGGMSQRVMIAMAIALDPDALIADEPTTALDVTIQAQIIALLRELQQETGMAMMLISHDLGVIAETVDQVAVMYAGQIVETGKADRMFERPGHPYTRGLIDSAPALERPNSELCPIGGTPPVPTNLPTGCSFNPRCRWRRAICTSTAPDLRDLGNDRQSACHFARDLCLDAAH